MNRNGENVTQITFDESRHYEHVAVSHDRRYVSAWVSELTRNALFGGYQLWFSSSGTPTACRLTNQSIK